MRNVPPKNMPTKHFPAQRNNAHDLVGGGV